MAINPFDESDYLGVARSRVTQQFKDKVVLDKFLQLMLQLRIDIQLTLKDLMQLRSLDTATGAALDILGTIVGQERTLYGLIYGDNPEPQTVLLDDDSYRLFIRAKIAKNSTRATPEDTMRFANLIFQTTGSTVQDEGAASYTLMIGKELTEFEQALVNYISTSGGYPVRMLPKPIGVRVNYGMFDPESFFAFEGVEGGKGYGSLEDLSIGGKYASLI